MNPTPMQQDDSAAPAEQTVMRKMVPIGRISADQSMQVRGRIEPGKVKDYEAIIREQGFMDPLDLFFSLDSPITAETVFSVSDGFHRLEGYRAAGVKKIPCNLRPGSKTDAIKFALRKNGHHGAQMTNAEKRHAAEVAVADPEIGNMTDKDIAGMIGCSGSLVSEARRGITKEQATAKRKKSVEVSSHKRSSAGGKQETESTAPREATARERKPVDNRPTKAIVLRQTEDYLKTDVVDEQDLLALMEGKDAQYRFVKKPGEVTTLKVLGKSGRVQVEVNVVVKEIGYEGIVLKFEDGKMSAE